VSAAQRNSSPTSAGTVAELTVYCIVSLKIMNVPIFKRLVRPGHIFGPSARVLL
jgi:hypothetical protein